MDGSRRTSESSACCHLLGITLGEPYHVGERAYFAGQVSSDSGMSDFVALLMTRMWAVRGEGNLAMHVVIAQVCRGELVMPRSGLVRFSEILFELRTGLQVRFTYISEPWTGTRSKGPVQVQSCLNLEPDHIFTCTLI